MTPRTTDRDTLLDAWRGLSVLMVILSHGLDHHRLFVDGDGSFAALISAVAGPLGVKFFFVISGYIITSRLMAEHDRSGAVSLRGFYLRRAFRILPPLLVFLLCVKALDALGYLEITPKALAAGAAFLCNTSFEDCRWTVGHLWSLGVEEQFYLFWPLCLVVIGFRRIDRIALGFLVIFLLFSQAQWLVARYIDNGAAFACIAAGALYASSPLLRRLVHRFATPSVVGLVLLLLIFRRWIPLVTPGQFRANDIALPWMVMFIMFASFRARAWFERRLTVTLLARIGVVSYSLYLWQQLFLAPAWAQYRLPEALSWPPLLVVCALASYFLVERPMIAVGARLARAAGRRGPVAAPQPADATKSAGA